MMSSPFNKMCWLVGLAILTAVEIWAQEPTFRDERVGHIYHVSVPPYMTKGYGLNDAASMQYLNAAKETYVIVIEDDKDQLNYLGSTFSGPGEFYQFFEMQFADASSTIGPMQSLTIQGNPAVQVEITKPFEEYTIAYLITVIESDTHFYKMLAWTLAEYKDQYFQDFKTIASSLRELHP